MDITRQIIAEKLNDFLLGKISDEDIHGWVLSAVMDPVYPPMASEDPLMAAVMVFLMDIDQYDLAAASTLRVMEYYRLCLKGEIEYMPLEDFKEWGKIAVPQKIIQVSRKTAGEKGAVHKGRSFLKSRFKPLPPASGFFTAMRIYVLIFAVGLLAGHLFSTVNPGFLHLRQIPGRWENFLVSLPHILFALLVLLPMRLSAGEMLYPFVFPLMTLGAFYYWYISLHAVSGLGLPFVMMLCIVPFCALPATMSVILLILAKERLKS